MGAHKCPIAKRKWYPLPGAPGAPSFELADVGVRVVEDLSQLVSPLEKVGLQARLYCVQAHQTNMTKTSHDIRSQLIGIVEPVCESSGYELVDLRYQREQGGWVVRIFIDRSGGTDAPIGFADCEQVSRELSAVLDVEDPLPSAYSLEVSSPGVERPLRTAAHFRRYAGRGAKVVLEQGLDGRRNFKGTVEGFDEPSEKILIRVDGEQFALPLSDVRTARLVVDWEDVLKKGKPTRQKEQAGA